MTDELAALVADGRVRQQGTFNGNPLVMAAAQATLLEVLTPEAYKQLHAANEKLMAGCDRVIAEYGLPGAHRRPRLQGLRRDVDASRCASTATT